MDRRPGFRCRRNGAQPWRHHADPAGIQRQELAVPPRRRPPRGDSAQRCAGGNRPRLAADRIDPLSGAPARRVGSKLPGCPVQRAGHHRHHSGIVRPGRARTDRRSRPQRRLSIADAAGRAAGGAVQLDSEQRRPLAQAGAAGRHHPGGRCRRRHQRLLADRGGRARRQSGIAPRRGRRAHPARRRQYGPDAGARSGAQAGRQRYQARRLADARLDLRLP